MLLPVLAALVLQGLLLAHAFPLSQLMTDTPILGIDHPYHLYQIRMALAFAEHGHLTGYDPFFGAGYVGGVNFNASAKGPALLAWLLRDLLQPVVAYKLYVAAAAWLAPALATFAAAMLRLPARQVWCCAALAGAAWWASALHWYHTAGLVSFIFVSFAALPFCVLLDRLFDAPRAAAQTVLAGVLGAVLFFLHPFFAIPAVFFGAARLVVARPSVPLPIFTGRVAAVAVLSLVPNLPWLVAMSGQASIGPSRYSVAYQMLVDHRLVWMELLGLTAGPAKGAKVYPLLVLMSLGSWRGPPGALRTWCRAGVLAWFGLVLFGAFGAALPFIGPVQPNRFSSTAYLFLVLPAAVGIFALWQRARSALRWPRRCARGLVALLLVLGVAVADEVRREVSYAPSGRYGSAPPEVRGVGPKGQALLAWLRDTTHAEGRVLFETSLGRVHDGGHIAGYLQAETGREFIGGPYNNFFAGTRDGWMFGRPLAQIEPQQFLAYLRLYNIGWIVVHSVAAKQYLEGIADSVVPGAAFEGLQTYAVRQPLSFVESGRAQVTQRGYGRLVVERRGADSAEPIVLRYHFIPSLRATDGSPVEPVMLLDDPDPFIRVTPRGAVVELVR